jgi:uncharacterized membrane protein YedE/YeeE
VRNVLSFGCGLLFAVGLAIGGMTNPAKVIAFLDVTGAWDPSLAFVMGGALGVYALAWQLRRLRSSPVLGGRLPPPIGGGSTIDGRLVAGAAIFGLGWGVAGYCPGPAIASVLVTRNAPIFALAMVAGMALVDRTFGVRRVRLQPANES